MGRTFSLIVTLLGACTSLVATELRAQPREVESARVYAAMFDVLFHQGHESPGKIVLFDSTSWDAANLAYKGRLVPPHTSVVDVEVIEDFEKLNRSPSLLSPSAAIAQIAQSRPGTRLVAMYTRTMTYCRFNKLCRASQLARLALEGSIEQSTVDDFLMSASNPAALRPQFAQALGLHTVTDAEFQYLSEQADPPGRWTRGPQTDSTRFWSVFHRVHGRRAGIVSVTRPGFDSGRTQALVEVRVDTSTIGRNGPPSRMMLLKKNHGNWTVESENVGSGISSGNWDGSKCVAVAPPSHTATWYEALRLNGDYEISVVSTAGNLYAKTYRVHIGYNARRPTPQGSARFIVGPFSFQALDDRGNYSEAATLDLSIEAEGTDIPRNSAVYMLDGYHHRLTILAITGSGFFGNFAAGVFADDEAGHFCARLKERIH